MGDCRSTTKNNFPKNKEDALWYVMQAFSVNWLLCLIEKNFMSWFTNINPNALPKNTLSTKQFMIDLVVTMIFTLINLSGRFSQTVNISLRAVHCGFSWTRISWLSDLSSNRKSGFGSDDCDVGSTRSVLGMRKLERTCFRVNPEAFNTIRILACHKNKLSTRGECEVPSVRVSRKRAPT